MNEREVFTRSNVKPLFESYLVVQIYTDVVPQQFYAPNVKVDITRQRADAEVNREFQGAVFRDRTLPLYAVLEPRGNGKVEVVGTYGGRIFQADSFAAFLKNPVGKKLGSDGQASR